MKLAKLHYMVIYNCKKRTVMIQKKATFSIMSVWPAPHWKQFTESQPRCNCAAVTCAKRWFFSSKVQISEGMLKENSSAALAHLKAYQEKKNLNISTLYIWVGKHLNIVLISCFHKFQTSWKTLEGISCPVHHQ